MGQRQNCKQITWKQAPDTNCSAFVCAKLRESKRERRGEGEKEGGEVYGLLNARLTTGGSSSVNPIKTKQNGGSVQ